MQEELALKFKINKVGRIAEAAIGPKMFTIFMGKNDTGKTYAAATIWSFIDFIKQIPRNKNLLSDTEYDSVIKQIKRNLDSGILTATLTPAQLNSIRLATVQYFNNNIRTTLEAAIGYDGFNASKFNILDYENSGALNVSFHLEEYRDLDEQADGQADTETRGEEASSEDEEAYDDPETYWNFECKITDETGEVIDFSIDGVPSTILLDHVLDDIGEYVIGYACFGKEWNYYRNTIYVPAARTGIMLALNYFVEGAIGRSSRSVLDFGKEIDRGMPAPIQGFASNLVRPFFAQGKSLSALSRLIRGELKRSKKRGLFLFSPEGSRAEIPLAAASSLVTELAALSLMSRRFQRPTFLIFEEPEAHLHLEAQREMARLLAQLVRASVKILVTTHSDTFIQQINNLVALSDHPEKTDLLARFELSENDTIERDQICAYDFDCKNGETRVIELPLTRTGFVAESLNEVLRKLALETVAIGESISEDSNVSGESEKK